MSEQGQFVPLAHGGGEHRDEGSNESRAEGRAEGLDEGRAQARDEDPNEANHEARNGTRDGACDDDHARDADNHPALHGREDREVDRANMEAGLSGNAGTQAQDGGTAVTRLWSGLANWHRFQMSLVEDSVQDDNLTVFEFLATVTICLIAIATKILSAGASVVLTVVYILLAIFTLIFRLLKCIVAGLEGLRIKGRASL